MACTPEDETREKKKPQRTDVFNISELNCGSCMLPDDSRDLMQEKLVKQIVLQLSHELPSGLTGQNLVSIIKKYFFISFTGCKLFPTIALSSVLLFKFRLFSVYILDSIFFLTL
jgi:hypothetical protein